MKTQLVKYFFILSTFLFVGQHFNWSLNDSLKNEKSETAAAFLAQASNHISTVSQSLPHQKNKTQHFPFLVFESENEDDEDSSENNEFLKCKDHFITLFNFNTIVEEDELGSSNYAHAEVNTLPTDHFLFLEYQVFRI